MTMRTREARRHTGDVSLIDVQRTLRGSKDREQDPTERLLLALHLQGRPPFLHGVLTMSSGDQHLQARWDADAANPWSGDLWPLGIDFMGPFQPSDGKEYILVAVDYVSKWVEAIPTRTNDHRQVLWFITRCIFARYDCPRAIINHGGSHFNESHFHALLKKYGVHHCITTPYHP